MKKNTNEIKKKSNDIQLAKNAIDIDKEILKWLSTTPFVKMVTVIEDIKKKTGVSRITIVRKIKRLAYERELAKIHYDDFKRYNIQEIDKRQVYLASKETLKLKEHIDDIFKLFNPKTLDFDEAKIGVRELRYYSQIHNRQYSLDSNELDTLSSLLERTTTDSKFKDDEFRSILLNVIFTEITMNRVKPSNDESLVETLTTLLDQYPMPESHSKPNNPIGSIIYLLGIFRSKKVIERLKDDAIKCPPTVLQSVTTYYVSRFTAKTIENAELELMRYQAKLQKEHKVESIDFIENIRRQSAYELSQLKVSRFEKYLFEEGDNL